LGTKVRRISTTHIRPVTPLLANIVGAKTAVQTRKALWGYLFALPWILGLIIFFGGPILASAYFSVTEYSCVGYRRASGANIGASGCL